MVCSSSAGTSPISATRPGPASMPAWRPLTRPATSGWTTTPAGARVNGSSPTSPPCTGSSTPEPKAQTSPPSSPTWPLWPRRPAPRPEPPAFVLMALRIEDYALIGDTQTAALVGRDGSIDWLCLPRFDSAACFAALLGDPRNGRWVLSPVCDVRRVRRRYRPGTLILETEFETEDGMVRVIDCMPPRERAPDVIRVVE